VSGEGIALEYSSCRLEGRPTGTGTQKARSDKDRKASRGRESARQKVRRRAVWGREVLLRRWLAKEGRRRGGGEALGNTSMSASAPHKIKSGKEDSCQAPSGFGKESEPDAGRLPFRIQRSARESSPRERLPGKVGHLGRGKGKRPFFVLGGERLPTLFAVKGK